MSRYYYKNECLEFSSKGLPKCDILCDFDTDDDNWKEVNLKTSDVKIKAFLSCSTITLNFCLRNRFDVIVKSIEIRDSYLLKVKSAFLNGRFIYSLCLFPKEVFITVRDDLIKRSDADVIFHISDAPMIAPHLISHVDREGNLSHEKSSPIKIKINGRKLISSDLHFTYSINGNKFELESSQVLKINIRRRGHVIEIIEGKYLPVIDQILFLCSFLHDVNVTCHSWSLSYPAKIVHCYRCNQFPDKEISLSRLNERINRNDVEEFLSRTLNKSLKSPYCAAIKNAISALILDDDTPIELTYMTYFQALESFVLTYKRLRAVELVIIPNKFRKIRGKITEFIKCMDLVDERAKEKLISKLPELNRISLKEAALCFFQEFSIEIEIMWPIFDNRTGVTLNDLRNMLAHGELIPDEQFENLVVAHENLKILLVKVIFSVLEWPIERTMLSNDKLYRYHSLQDDVIKLAQYELSCFKVDK